MTKKNIKIEDNRAIKYIYSRSASIFAQIPEGIFFPKDKTGIKEIIRYAKKRNLSILAKGAGTSRSGQDVNSSIVVDLTKHFNKILNFDEKNSILTIESGVTLKEVNKFLEKYDLFFPPDPSSGNYCTIGGMLGNNSGGARALKYGVMRDYVVGVEVILNDENIYQFPKDNSHIRFKKITNLLLDNKRLIDKYYPTTVKNSAGYNLKNIFTTKITKRTQGYAPTTKITGRTQGYAPTNQEKNIAFEKLFVSSEGTLGIVTEISIKAIPIPKFRKNFILTADNLTEVIQLVKIVKEYLPEKIELIDKDILKLAKLNDDFVDKIINSTYQYILLISFSGASIEKASPNTSTSLSDRPLLKEGAHVFVEGNIKPPLGGLGANILQDVKSNKPPLGGLGAHPEERVETLTSRIKDNILEVKDEDEYEKMFELRKTAAGYIHRSRDRNKPIPVIEDLQVDFSKFELFTNGIKDILKKYSVDAFFFGHIGDGNIHINTFFNILSKDDRKKANILRREVHKFIISIGGSLTGEHGDGKLRSIDLENQYPKLYPLFRKIKSSFDPKNIFNPNNMIVFDKLTNPFDNLRLNLEEEYSPPKEISDYFYISEIEACNGCGKCRDYCPSFLANGDERYTTRARLTLFQGLIGGDLELDDFKEKSFKETIDSCIGCHICASECPTGVDAGKLIFKLKKILDEDKPILNQIVKENDIIGKIGQKIAPLSNFLLSSKVVKKINEKVLGFSEKIELPKFQKHKLLKIEDYLIDESQLDTLPENAVIYFSGCFANFYSTESEFYSTIKVLEYFKFKPYLINFKCCGISKINEGISIKNDATRNVELFNKITKYNIPIIFTSPSCREAVVELYPFLNRKWAHLDYYDNIYDIFTFLRRYEYSIQEKASSSTVDKPPLVGLGAPDLEKTEIIQNQKSSRKGISILKEFTSVNDVKSYLLTTKFKDSGEFIQYHPPCHTRGTSTSQDIQYILEKVGYRVDMLPENCCGMAGTFGNYKKNLEKSLKIGESQLNLIDKNKKDVITSCGTCQVQINTHTNQRVEHPIKYLYDAIKRLN